MREQQNNNTDASSSRAPETAQSEQHQCPGLYICIQSSPPPDERLPASRATFGFGRRRVPCPVSLPSPGEMRAISGAFGFAPWHSVPASPSPSAVDQRLEDYFRPRSMSAPEMLGDGFWPSALYAELYPNGTHAQYDDLVDDLGLSYGPGLFHAPPGLYNMPGSYSPVLGYGPWPEQFYGPGLFRATSIDSGDSSGWNLPPTLSNPPRTQQPEQLQPGEFIELHLGRAPTPPPRPMEPEPGVPALTWQRCELENGESCSCSRYVIMYVCPCHDSPPQQSDNPEGTEDLEDEDPCTCDLHRQMRGEY
ncbi:hypothetical protein F5883DRAFT_690111 [Diaporthe sp. PMI_573]|nr:hypothetical protein F5883DRAFT_690111 [Diaporthaceae sp. PMI_573]